jgi:1-acyl-sn-glycerol-3-phosphate acyltransferase
MLYLRSFLANMVFYLNVSLWLIAILPTLVLPRRCGPWILRNWGASSRWIMKVLAGIDYEIRGLDNLPVGAALIACKHQSAWETFALLPLFSDPTFVMKKELRLLPVFGWFTIKFKMIAIDRSQRRLALQDMLEGARQALAEGRQVIIFPEGTRAAVDAKPRYKWGIAHLYDKLAVPCTPIAHNAGQFWPRQSFLRRPGKVIVDILPPIEPGLAPDVFLIKLQNTIEERTGELIALASPSQPSL